MGHREVLSAAAGGAQQLKANEPGYFVELFAIVFETAFQLLAHPFLNAELINLHNCHNDPSIG